MAKKLTLKEAWRECLGMWKWICEQGGRDIPNLKRIWINKFYSGRLVLNNCFACEYVAQKHNVRDPERVNCKDCILNKGFHGCMKDRTHYKYHPLAFYRLLLKLKPNGRSKERSRLTAPNRRRKGLNNA